MNAAVEAARAGEAGAGFAVVADEVRNLAMRAAEAAKTTSHLIDGTSQRVTDGATYVTRVGQAFDEISQSAGKVGELVAEIAAASSEQAQGVEQINRAVTEMSQVVQQNAATAEESAAASEEMNAQAEQMGHMVGGLIRLVDSANGNSLSTALRPGPAPCAKSASETSSVGSSPAESTPRPVIPQ